MGAPRPNNEGGLQLPLFFNGEADDLVEARQSVRLCDALAGRTLIETDQSIPALTELSTVLSCGDDSTLQRVQLGKHALDVRFESMVVTTDLHLSGNEASRIEVATAIRDATQFADRLTTTIEVTDAGQPNPAEAQPSNSGGGGWLS